MDCRKESLILQIHTYKQLSLKFDINVYHATAHTYILPYCLVKGDCVYNEVTPELDHPAHLLVSFK